MDDDFGADADFVAALAASESGPSSRPAGQAQQPSRGVRQPPPQRIAQPTPQRLDRAPPGDGSGSGSKIVQPTPQALPSRGSGSSILVSPRQKGNPVLANLRSMPWEYSDIPADYGLGLTTCALFLSLKYHRLHPEYIYTRIRNLHGKYNLRILLAMVDIPNHEDSLRELSKTSLVNNVTIILCWSAAEAARYLELYKSYEHANYSAIRGQQATSYAEKLVEFVTVPRNVNKSDAIGLVSTFASLKNAINADPEAVSAINGWGEKKVKSWTKAVEEPFRIQTAARRGLGTTSSANGGGSAAPGDARRTGLDEALPLSRVPLREMAEKRASRNVAEEPAPEGPDKQQNKPRQFQIWDPDLEDDEDAMIAAAMEESQRTAAQEEARQDAPAAAGKDDGLTDGVAAALAKLRERG